jgi:hypothetical protein
VRLRITMVCTVSRNPEPAGRTAASSGPRTRGVQPSIETE